MNTYDVVILGSGPGGYVAALRAAQRGLKTAVVEKEQIGGVCLNWGCIPTKAIIHSVNRLRDIREAGELGIEADAVRADMSRIISRSREVAGRLSKGVAYLLKKQGVTVIEGHGRLLNEHELRVEKAGGESETVHAEHLILATGSRPKSLPHIPVNGTDVISSRHALELETLPERMVIIGAGAIGIEFAYIYKHLGVDATVIEALDAILPNEDADISKELLRQFKKQKIRCLTGSKVTRLERTEQGLDLTLEQSGETLKLQTDMILSAVGVAPNTEDIGLETVGIALERGFVKTDANGMTSVPGIYAIGDMAGTPCLAHKASREALIAIDHIQGRSPAPLDPLHIPGCTYCEPQVASVGLRERDAVSRKIDHTVSTVFYRAIGKAIAIGRPDGFLKCVVDAKTHKVLGAHCIGAEATELIAELTLALSRGMTVEMLAETIHAHPTLSELIMETAENALGEAIHV